MRQIDEVRKAYLAGCRTTVDVERQTGLPRSYCSAYTRDLLRSGLLVRAGVAPEKSAAGRWVYYYEAHPRYRSAFNDLESIEPDEYEKIIELFLAGADERIDLAFFVPR